MAMNAINRKRLTIGLRFIQLLSIAAFVFGGMWTSADTLKLSLAEFLMLYGFVGIVVPEVMIRLMGPTPTQPKFRGKGGR